MEQLYLPAAQNYLERAEDKGGAGSKMLIGSARWSEHWYRLRFGAMQVDSDAEPARVYGAGLSGRIEPDAVRVEIFAAAGESCSRKSGRNDERGQVWRARAIRFVLAAVAADRPAEAFTPRIVPDREGAACRWSARGFCGTIAAIE